MQLERRFEMEAMEEHETEEKDDVPSPEGSHETRNQTVLSSYSYWSQDMLFSGQQPVQDSMDIDFILPTSYCFNKERNAFQNVCAFVWKIFKSHCRKSFVFPHIHFQNILDIVIKSMGPKVTAVTGDHCIAPTLQSFNSYEAFMGKLTAWTTVLIKIKPMPQQMNIRSSFSTFTRVQQIQYSTVLMLRWRLLT